MVIPKINSAHGSDTRNIINRAIDLINAQGKSIQDLVAEGQLTPTQYATLLQSINGLISKGNVKLDDLDQEVLQKFGEVSPEFNLLSIPRDKSVTNEKIVDSSVSLDKTTFYKKGSVENLFDGNYYQGTLYAALDDVGVYHFYPLRNESNFTARTAVVKVKKNTQYTLRIPNKNSSDRFKVGASKTNIDFQSSNGTPTATHKKLDRIIYSVDKENLEPLTFNSREEEWIYIQTSGSGQEPRIIFVEGNTAPLSDLVIGEDFIDDFSGEKILDKTLSHDKMKFFKENAARNLFDGKYLDGMLFATQPASEWFLIPLNNYSTFRGKLAIVPIEKNKKYYVKVFDPANTGPFRVGASKTYPVLQDYATDLIFNAPIPSRYKTLEKNVITPLDKYSNEVVFNNTDFNYLVIYVSNAGKEVELIVSEDENVSIFRSRHVIDQKHMDLEPLEKMISGVLNNQKNSKYNFPINLNTLYRKNEIENFIENPQSFTVANYNTMFNSLITSHSNIAKSTYLGDAEFGYKLYQYENTPTPYKKTETEGYAESKPKTDIKLPKIVITAGIHGRERAASYACYYFFKELLENPNDDPVLDFLLRNVHLIFVPVICASGFEDNTYENRNGQNLNRDFGPYGNFTQAETKLVKKVIDDNKDMDFHLDFHTTPALEDPIGYTLTNDESLSFIGNNMYREVGRAWQKENPAMPQKLMHEWGYTTPANIGTAGLYSETAHGIPSTIFEVVWQNKWLSNQRNGEDVTRMGVDILTNMILGTLRSKQ